MKISITGSGGFIGRYLVNEFGSTTHEVYRVPTEYLQSVKPNPEHEDCEITAQIRSSDYVIHLAARNNDQTGTKNDFNEDNFILTKSLIAHCKRLGVENIIFSQAQNA